MQRKIIDYLNSEAFNREIHTGLIGDVTFLVDYEKLRKEIDPNGIKSTTELQTELLYRTTVWDLGLPSPLLQNHGITGKSITISVHALRKALGTHPLGGDRNNKTTEIHNHNINKDDMYNLANLLQNPLAILREPLDDKNIIKGFHQDRFLLVLNSTDAVNKQIVVPVRLPNEESPDLFIPTIYGYECSSLINLLNTPEAVAYAKENLLNKLFRDLLENLSHQNHERQEQRIADQQGSIGSLQHEEMEKLTNNTAELIRNTTSLEQISHLNLQFYGSKGNSAVFAVKKSASVFEFFAWKFDNIINGFGKPVRSHTNILYYLSDSWKKHKNTSAAIFQKFGFNIPPWEELIN